MIFCKFILQFLQILEIFINFFFILNKACFCFLCWFGFNHWLHNGWSNKVDVEITCHSAFLWSNIIFTLSWCFEYFSKLEIKCIWIRNATILNGWFDDKLIFWVDIERHYFFRFCKFRHEWYTWVTNRHQAVYFLCEAFRSRILNITYINYLLPEFKNGAI